MSSIFSPSFSIFYFCSLSFSAIWKKSFFTKPCRAADILYRSELLQCCLFEISNFTILSFMWFYASLKHVELHRLFTRRFISNYSRVLLGALLIGFISEMFFCVFHLKGNYRIFPNNANYIYMYTRGGGRLYLYIWISLILEFLIIFQYLMKF